MAGIALSVATAVAVAADIAVPTTHGDKEKVAAAEQAVDTGDAGDTGTDSEAASTDDVDDVQNVENVETVNVVNPVSPNGQEGSSDTASDTPHQPLPVTVGRLHPAFVHFPLGLLIALLLYELLALKDRQHAGAGVRYFPEALWGITLASFLPAIISGLLRARELAAMGDQLDVNIHRNLMITAFSLFTITAICRATLRKKYTRGARLTCIGLLVLATLLAFIGAHMGGKLVYGDTFLPF